MSFGLLVIITSLSVWYELWLDSREQLYTLYSSSRVVYVSSKVKIIQNIYWRNATYVAQLMRNTIKVLQLCSQSCIILLILITRKLSSRWNLADNVTGLNTFNWRGKNLWAATSQSHSYGPELQIYECGSSPVRGIWRKTLTKTIAPDRLVPWIFSQFSCGSQIRFRWSSSLPSIHGRQIKLQLSSTFDFHARLPNLTFRYHSRLILISKLFHSHDWFQISHRGIKSTTLNIGTSLVTIREH